MLDKNPKTRATLDELLKSTWVTKGGQEIIDVSTVEKGAYQFGNIRRHVAFNQKTMKIKKNLL